jgi:hypothetical protein
VAGAVSRRPLTIEVRVQSRVNPCEICGGQSGTGTGFSPSTSVSPCQFIPPIFNNVEKHKKKLIVFITGSHNKPQGRGAPVSSAGGPSPQEKKKQACNRPGSSTRSELGCIKGLHSKRTEISEVLMLCVLAVTSTFCLL